MGFFHWLWIARLFKVMSIVSFSFVKWILSVVIVLSLAYRLLRVLCLFDLLHLCSCRSGNLSEDGFTRLAVPAIFRQQRAIRDDSCYFGLPFGICEIISPHYHFWTFPGNGACYHDRNEHTA
jgi:hypothetical protein